MECGCKEQLVSSLTLIRTFWFTFVGAQGIYAALAALLRTYYPGFSGFLAQHAQHHPSILLSSIILGVIALAAAQWLRSKQLSRQALLQSWQLGMTVFGQYLENSFLKYIVLSEVPALLGLLLFIAFGSLWEFVIFSCASLLSCSLFYPSVRWYRKLVMLVCSPNEICA